MFMTTPRAPAPGANGSGDCAGLDDDRVNPVCTKNAAGALLATQATWFDSGFLFEKGPVNGFQFTKRRMRMFMTMPSARNVNRIDDPP